MKVKTAELSGKALDWATGRAIGANVGITIGGLVKEITSHNPIDMSLWQPTNDWSICGPLIEKLKISCYASVDPESSKVYHWVAVNEKVPYDKRRGYTASEPKIAICRAVVASKLGDEVDIPDELMESK